MSRAAIGAKAMEILLKLLEFVKVGFKFALALLGIMQSVEYKAFCFAESETDSLEQLESLNKELEDFMERMREWYLLRRITLKIWSALIRYTSVVLIFFATMWPVFMSFSLPETILEHLKLETDEDVNVAMVGYLFAGAAAGLHLIDRTCGFSKAMLRYSTTAMDILALMERHKFAWNSNEISARKESSQFITKQKKCLLMTLDQFLTLVSNETTQWSTDFKSDTSYANQTAKRLRDGEQNE